MACPKGCKCRLCWLDSEAKNVRAATGLPVGDVLWATDKARQVQALKAKLSLVRSFFRRRPSGP